jgi:dienelactone hydrolase
MKTYAFSSAIVGLVLMATTPVHAQFARQEVHPLSSVDMSAADFLTGKKGTPVTIAGHLRLPKVGEKLPAVILVHGAGGVGGARGYIDEWARVLNEAGYATFTLDAWSGRGLTNIAADITRVSPLSRIAEAYRALEHLAKHSMIDPARIVVMGFSHGGPSALYSGLKRFQKMHASDIEFAGHISVYGPCNTAYRDDEDMTKPILMLHGSADDWVLAAPCREFAARLAKAGKDVRFIEYAGADHVFDAPALRQPVKFAQGLSSRRCALAEGNEGIVMNVETKRPFDANDSCLERGTTIAYHEEALKKAQEDVKAFLKEVFKK